MPELVAKQLCFGFGDKLLLNEICLNLRTSEMIVCLGENASGKTTLLRLLSGLLLPASGEIHIHGTNHPSPRGQVGILFQNPDHQMIAATVEEEIALGMEMRGVPQGVMRTSVDSLLKRFALTEFAHRPLQALSGGQKQRVALAAVMALKPIFLLFDEPDSFLDAPSRRDLMDAVSKVRPECGILWTCPHPHHMPLADKYCVLQDGRLEATSREVILALGSGVRTT